MFDLIIKFLLLLYIQFDNRSAVYILYTYSPKDTDLGIGSHCFLIRFYVITIKNDIWIFVLGY